MTIFLLSMCTNETDREIMIFRRERMHLNLPEEHRKDVISREILKPSIVITIWKYVVTNIL